MDSPIFDYITASRKMDIPSDVVHRLEEEARKEFPQDEMMVELHVVRALNAYAEQRQRGALR